MKNKYSEMIKKHQQEINSFPIMFAFNKKQFKEGLEKLGVRPDGTDKLVSIGYGGYIKESDVKDYLSMFKKHRQECERLIESDKTGDGFIYDMFCAEMENHEYGYTLDVKPVFKALGLTLDEINKDKRLLHGFERARNTVVSNMD